MAFAKPATDSYGFAARRAGRIIKRFGNRIGKAVVSADLIRRFRFPHSFHSLVIRGGTPSFIHLQSAPLKPPLRDPPGFGFVSADAPPPAGRPGAKMIARGKELRKAATSSLTFMTFS